ncbi:hypothetical protein BCY86_04665 [Pajaroellobacter abortibovis]|uniref:HotDog ACOT-type domain-containing protein n=2 Tax=Pajaroellobacter abortibovis TaxID=1882918 RepID=A0A1L6MZC2_9BACT|nr:hypothetical protein BCY86_04665 [Pajaroellobacter abortibovis]
MDPLACLTRASSSSVTEMTEYVLPQHTNAFGTVFGGQMMAWIDLCGAICAQRHSGYECVTAFVDNLRFTAPVKVGEVVLLRAHVTAIFCTSMEVEVVVRGEDARSRRTWPCVNTYLTFVATDAAGKPVQVPLLELDTPESRASQEAGERRRKLRMEHQTHDISTE